MDMTEAEALEWQAARESSRQLSLWELKRFQEALDEFTFPMLGAIQLEALWLEDRIYGYRVKTTAAHHIDLYRMIYNWRIVTVPVGAPMFIDRGWCYQGTGLNGFLPAALAAIAWDGSDTTEPAGYFKRAGA